MYKDITNQKFGRLLAVSYAGSKLRGNGQRLAIWNCLCDCGSEVVLPGATLRSGNTTSCGCWQIESTIKRSTTHGMANTKEYTSYLRMIARCTNPNTDDFHDYMGRGITVCQRWLESFQNFFDDMGRAPSSSHSIERIDVNGNYSPENCKWGTPTEQARNKQRTRKAMFKGELLPVATIAELLNKPYTSVIYRLNHNIQIEDWN